MNLLLIHLHHLCRHFIHFLRFLVFEQSPQIFQGNGRAVDDCQIFLVFFMRNPLLQAGNPLIQFFSVEKAPLQINAVPCQFFSIGFISSAHLSYNLPNPTILFLK